MARKDQLTGKGPVAGNHVSHAHNKAKRRFEVNLQKKRFYIPEEDRWVTLRVSAQTIKTINKNGISAVLAEARRGRAAIHVAQAAAAALEQNSDGRVCGNRLEWIAHGPERCRAMIFGA